VGYAVASSLAAALWIAISTVAPEFLWRGLRIAVFHLDHATLISALLIGLFLAFFVEPGIERLRALLQHGSTHRGPREERRGVLFTTLVGLAFAFASVCLHDAMLAYLSGHAGAHAPVSGLAAAISLTIAWSIVPFIVTLAWLSRRRLWLAVPIGIAGVASSLIAGLLFRWTPQDIVVTTIPCVVIQFLGYRALAGGSEGGFVRCARSLAGLAVAWLVFRRLELYNAAGFWMDARFYLGWTIGLLLAPFPGRTIRA
jgi:hypothetical protein